MEGPALVLENGAGPAPHSATFALLLSMFLACHTVPRKVASLCTNPHTHTPLRIFWVSPDFPTGHEPDPTDLCQAQGPKYLLTKSTD